LKWLAPREAVLKRYFFGQLDTSRRARLEERLVADDALFERMQVIEDELLDAYVRDEMEPAERRLFETTYLADARGREKLLSARTLLQCLADAGQSVVDVRSEAGASPRWAFPGRPLVANFRLAAAVMTLVAAVGGVWLVTLNRGAGDELPDARGGDRAAQPTAQIPRSVALEALGGVHQAGPVPAIVLTPRLRGESTRSVVIRTGPHSNLIVLQLQLDGSRSEPYRVLLQTTGGAEVWRQELSNPTPSVTSSLVVVIPGSLMRAGDYRVLLQTRTGEGPAEEVRTYDFRVVPE
jgi:hypothetical protein